MISKKRLSCPHCRLKSVERQPAPPANHLIRESSYQEDEWGLLRRNYYRCANPTCGWSAQGREELEKELSPPAVRNPAVQLPIAAPDELRSIRQELLGEGQDDLFSAGVHCEDN